MSFSFSPSRRRALCLSAAVACTPIGLSPTWARASTSWPNKPVTMLVPFTAGGPTDTQMRAIANAAGKLCGQPWLVVNQPGVSGTLAPTTMANGAAPDGHTLSLITPALFRLPHLQKVSYDAMTDFSYIAGLTSYVYGLSVANDARWKTLEDLVAYARQNPGRLNVAAVGRGTLGHITASQLERKAGVSINYVPFKGGSEAVTALLGGHVDAMLEAGWGAMAQAGRLRVLAVAEEQRLPRWPDVPTLRERGLDIVVQSIIGVAGPKGMAPEVLQRIAATLREATQDAAYVRALETESMPNRFLATAAYQQYTAAQFEADRRNVRELGIRLD